MDSDSDEPPPSSPPRDTDTDDSSDDDEPPRTDAPRHVRSVAHGTYGTVVRVLHGRGAEIRWEGGDESTLDADAYEAALKSYAKSPRAQGANDARRASTSSSSSEEDDADRQLLVGDELLSKCGSLVGRIIDISDEGDVTAEWSEPARPARRAEPKSKRRAARAKVCYAHDNDIDEPTALSMDDARALRKLWREKQRSGAVHAASSQEGDADAASSDDESEKHPWSDSDQSSQEDGGDAPENEQPPPPPPPRRMRSAPSEASEPTPPSAADDDESSSSSDEDEEPNQASNLPPPPTAVSRSETPEAAVVEDDWDEESDEDEDRRVANLSSQVVDPSQHTSQHASQDSRLSLEGAAAVIGRGAIDAAALRARILAARPESIVPPASATSAPKLRIVHSRHGEWWGHAGKLRIPGSDELRTTLHELGGESSWLGDKRKYCDIDLKRLNAEGYDIILVDRGASIAYQRQFKDTKQDFARTELERKYGHTVVRKPCVVAYSTDNGVPLETYEVVAVVAINTATTRAAWTPAAVDQVEVLLDTMKGHHNPAKRGSNTRSGKMFMAGALVRRWTAEELKKRKKRGNGRIDTYRINRAAAAEANYDGYISPLETVLTIMAALEAAVSPRLHRARLAVSAAINAPAIVGGFPREIGPSVTLALSQGYVSSQHLDSSGKWAWESIAWPPCRRAPSDWTFAIPGAGLLVDLSGPGGVYVTLNASRTVHGTLRSEISPDHDGIGIADILKHDMLSRNVVDAFEGGCKKRPALGAHN